MAAPRQLRRQVSDNGGFPDAALVIDAETVRTLPLTLGGTYPRLSALAHESSRYPNGLSMPRATIRHDAPPPSIGCVGQVVPNDAL